MLVHQRITSYVIACVTLITLSFYSNDSLAQGGDGINYQAVLRDANDNVLGERFGTITFTIYSGSPNGQLVYSEAHDSTTSTLGLLNIVIGSENPIGTDQFSEIDWSAGPHYLNVKADYTGSEVDLGTTQLVSVPYALYAKSSGDTVRAGAGIQVIGKDSVINVGDLSETNELITNIRLLNDSLLIIEEGLNQDTVDVSSLRNSVQNLTLDSVQNDRAYISIVGGNQINFSLADSDADSRNEIQTLTLNGTSDSLLLSNGGGAVALLDISVNTDNQDLRLRGDTLFISGGDSVNLNVFRDTAAINALQNQVNLNSLIGVDTIVSLNDSTIRITNLDGSINDLTIRGVEKDSSINNERIDSIDISANNFLRIFEGGALSDSVDLFSLNLSQPDSNVVSGSLTGDSIRLVRDNGNDLFIDISSLTKDSELARDTAALGVAIRANTTAISDSSINLNSRLLSRINADSLSRYINDTTLDGQLRDTSATLRMLIGITNTDDQQLSFNATQDTILLEDGGFISIKDIRDTVADFEARIAMNTMAASANAQGIIDSTADLSSRLLSRINADSLSRYINDTTLDGQLRDTSATLRMLIGITNTDDQQLSFNATQDTILLEDGGFISIKDIRDTVADFEARIAMNTMAASANAQGIIDSTADLSSRLLSRINADSLSRYINDTTLDGQLRDTSATLRMLIGITNTDDQQLSFNATQDTILLEDGGFISIKDIRDTVADFEARIALNTMAASANAQGIIDSTADLSSRLLSRINADSLSRYINDTTLDGQLRDTSATLRMLIGITNTDDQQLSFNATQDTILLEDGGFISIKDIRDTVADFEARIALNTMAASANAQGIIDSTADLSSRLLSRINADSLSRYINDTTLDGQLRDTSATLRMLIGITNTDDQQLSFNATQDTILLEDGGFISIKDIRDTVADFEARIALNTMAASANAQGIIDSTADLSSRLLSRINADSLSRYINDTTLDGQLRDTSATLRMLIGITNTDDQQLSFNATQDTILLEDGGFISIKDIRDTVADFEARIAMNTMAASANAQGIIDSTADLSSRLLSRINADSLSRYINDTTLDGQLRDTSATLRMLIGITNTDDQQLSFNATQDTILLEDGGFISIKDIRDTVADFEARIALNTMAASANAQGIIDSTADLSSRLLSRINADSLSRYINDTTLDGQLRDTSATLRMLIGITNTDDQQLSFNATQDTILLEDGGFISIKDIRDTVADFEARIAMNTMAASANAQGIIDSTADLSSRLLSRINADSLSRYINDTTLDGQLRDTSATLRMLIGITNTDDQQLSFNATQDTILLEDGGFISIKDIRDTVADFEARIAMNTMAASANAQGIIDSTADLSSRLLSRINADSLSRYINDTTLDGQLRDTSATLRMLIGITNTDDQQLSFNATQDTILLEDGGFISIKDIRDTVADFEARIALNTMAASANAQGIIDSTADLSSRLLSRINADSLSRYINDTTLDGQLRDSTAALRALVAASGSDDQAIGFSVTGDSIVLEDGGFVNIQYINDSIASYNSRISNNNTAIGVEVTARQAADGNLDTRIENDSIRLNTIAGNLASRIANDSSLTAQNRDSINTVVSNLSDTSSLLRSLILANSGTDDQQISFNTAQDSIVLEDGGRIYIGDIRDSLVDHNLRILTNASAISSNQTNIGNNATAIGTETTARQAGDNALDTRVENDSIRLNTIAGNLASRIANDSSLTVQNRDSINTVVSNLSDTSSLLRSLILANSGTDDQQISFNTAQDSIVLEDGGRIYIGDIRDSLVDHNLRILTNASAISSNQTNIGNNTTAIGTETTARQAADGNLDTRIENDSIRLNTIAGNLGARIASDSTLTVQNRDSINAVVSNLTDTSATLRSLINNTGDNLGNHTLDSNLRTNGSWISNDGDDEGIFIDNTGNIGLGTATPFSKMHIVDTINTTGLRISALRSGSTFNRGIMVNAQNATANNWGVLSTVGGGTGTSIAFAGYADTQSAGQNYGVYGLAGNGSTVNVGVFGNTYDTVGVNDAAVWALAEGTGTRNVAVKAEVTDVTNQSGTSIALLANASGADTNYAAYFESGLVYIADSLWIPQGAGDGKVLTSDQFGKARWEAIPNATMDDSTRIAYRTSRVYLASDSSIRFDYKNDEKLKVVGNRLEFINNANTINIGFEAGLNYTAGSSVSSNMFIGTYAGRDAGTGIANTAIGFRSGQNLGTGGFNTFLGYASGITNTGQGNVFLGAHAGNNIVNGDNNVYIGGSAGDGNENGSNNVFIGSNAGVGSTNLSNTLIINNGTGATPLIYGDFANDSVKVYGTLSVADEYALPSSDGAPNTVLSTDGNGQVSFVNPSALVSGDNLGDHTLDSNLRTNGSWISNDGDDEGVFIDNNGNVGINSNGPLNEKFFVGSDSINNTGGYEAAKIQAAGSSGSTAFQRGLVSYIKGTDGTNEAIYANSTGASLGSNRGVVARADSGSSNTGVFGSAGATPAGSNFAIGVSGQAGDISDGINYGVYGFARNSTNINRGVAGALSGTTTLNDAAVYGIANGIGDNIGLYGRANGTGVNLNSLGTNYGAYLVAENAATNYALFAQSGNVLINDTLILKLGSPANGKVLTSDNLGKARWEDLSNLSGSSIWTEYSSNSRAYYNQKVSIGGISSENNALTVYTDSLASNGITQYGESSFFNTLTLRNSDVDQRMSIGISNSASGNNLTIGTHNGTTWTNPFQIELGAPTNALRIDTIGRIGLGTSAPTSNLQITGANEVSLGANAGMLKIGEESGSHMIFDENEIQTKNDPTTAGQLLLQPDGGEVQIRGGVPGNNIMFTPDNKIGLGTYSPVDVITVERPSGGGRAAVNLNGESDGFMYSGLIMGNINDDRLWEISYRSGFGLNEGLLFQRREIGGTYVQHLFIDSTGSMGVGNTSPTAKLDVTGNIKADSIQLVGGTLGAGRVLTDVNGDGKASWQTLAAVNDNQQLTISADGDTLYLENSAAVYLPDSSNTNEIQSLSLMSGNIELVNADGTIASSVSLNDDDASNTNEAQTISKSGSTVTLTSANGSGGGTFADSALTEAQVDAFAGNNGYLTSEVDGSVTNEIQDLTINAAADSILINGGTGVRIADIRDSSLTDLADSTSVLRGLIPATSSDDQALTITAGKGKITLEDGGTIELNDSSATNELQTISKSGSTVTLSNGGGTFADSALTEAQVDAFAGNNGYLTSEVDGSVTNEIQDLTINAAADSILINGGTGVRIADIRDSSLTDLADSTSVLRGLIPAASSDDQALTITAGKGKITLEDGGTIELNDSSAINELQTISKSGSTVTLSNGGGTFADSALTEAQVDAYVANNGYSTGTDTLNIISDADRDTEILLDNGTDDDIIRIKQRGTEFIQIDSGKIYFTNTNNNIYIGEKAGETSFLTGQSNVGIGSFSLQRNTGAENTAVGFSSLLSNTSGGGNTAIGQRAMNDNQNGFSNTVLGYEALGRNVSGSGNVALGFNSGLLSTGSNNIFIGNNAGGTTSVGDDKLYIENSNSNTPLIYGDFNNDSLKIFGTLSIGNAFTLPTANGSAGQIMQANADGTVTWVNQVSGADGNGIFSGSGSLSGATEVIGGTNPLSFTSALQNAVVFDTTTLVVDAANNRVGIGTATPSSDLHMFNSSIADLTIEAGGDAANMILRAPSREWQIQNNSLGGGSFHIMDLTSGNTRFIITTTGRVGIGTTVPTQSLFQVVGGVRADSLIIDGEYSLPTEDGTANQILKTNGSGNLSFVDISTLVSGDNLGNHVLDSNLRTNSSWLSGDGDDEGIYIDNNGNVGIGATSVGAMLEVSDAANNYTARFTNTAVTSVTYGVTAIARGVGSGTNTGIYASASGGTMNNYAAFLDSGYVYVRDSLGIGTFNPAADLDVEGKATIDTLDINGNYTFPSTTGGADEVLVNDGSGNVTWEAVPGAITIPATFTKVGTAGNLYIETNERTASDWFDAAAACAADGYKLPTWAEWYGAAVATSITTMNDGVNWEWVADGTSNTARKVGFGTIKATANDDPDAGSATFRCVTYK